jgi:hypothetical protein
MSDGKISPKRDIVILSIKPKRPEYPPDKKYVLVKESLQEWDKLDAYYRGQILKLKSLSSSKNKSNHQHRSSSRKSSSRSSSRSSKKFSRRPAAGTQLTELFGDENIPLDDLGSGDEYLSDHEITLLKKSSSRKSREKSRDVSKKSKKSSKVTIQLDSEGGENEDEEDDNYLSVPRDNFVIEFAISAKKRTPLHRPETCHSPNFLDPIKVERYKPPAAMGFNGVHIQKILYHKTDGVIHTSPTTTSATTPEKPPDHHETSSSSSSPSLSICSNGSTGSSNKLDQHFDDDTPLILGTNPKTRPESAQISTSTKRNGNSKSESFLNRRSYSGHDNNNRNTKPASTDAISSSNKRKISYSEDSTAYDSSPKNGSSVSSTTTTTTPAKTAFSCDLLDNDPPQPANKRKSYHIAPKETKDAINQAVVEERKKKDTLMMGPPSSVPLKSISITESIIKKAKQGYKTAEMKERDRRRRLESQKRRAYAMEKGDEHQCHEFVDASMKALEMVTTYPLLSPIRSP